MKKLFVAVHDLVDALDLRTLEPDQGVLVLVDADGSILILLEKIRDVCEINLDHGHYYFGVESRGVLFNVVVQMLER